MRGTAIAMFAAMALIWTTTGCRVDAQVVDRMLAIVDGQVVTAGDLAQYRAVAAYFGEDDLPQDWIA